MNLDYNPFNILVLFGAIQGIILCFFLNKRRYINSLAVNFFLLFLFSLSFFNLIYACLDMDVFKYYRPLHLFPFPYKWLIGVGFYFYIKSQFPVFNNEQAHYKKEWYLFLPALIYLILKSYWFAISVSENSYRITALIVNSGFFRIHEFFILFFTLFMGVFALKFIQEQEENIIIKSVTAIQWLKWFTIVFIFITVIDILLYTLDLIINSGIESFGFYYATLIINAIYIYWIGFVGFTKFKLFFNTFKYNGESPNAIYLEISDKLKHAIQIDRIHLNSNLTLAELSAKIKVSSKMISKYVNETENMNFSEYINRQRVEAVKQLMTTIEAKKYTLVTLAEKSGFSSKSSFNSIFKKVTGKTPSQYRKTIH